jgi:hypothetical protein
MTIFHQTVAICTRPQLRAEAPRAVQKVEVYVFNNDSSANMWVGDSSVSNTGSDLGYKIPKDTGYNFELFGGEQLWGVSTTNISVSVMTTGNY